jgi:hypothetical protein
VLLENIMDATDFVVLLVKMMLLSNSLSDGDIGQHKVIELQGFGRHFEVIV